MVRQEKHKPSCSPRARQIQHTGRSAEPSVQANFDRMVFGSGCLQPSSISYRLPKHRPVCDSSQQQTTSLCFPYSRRQSSSNRRSINELDRIHAYAFPPFALIPAIISKIRQHQCKIVLVAPFWPEASWFPELLRLLVDLPSGFL